MTEPHEARSFLRDEVPDDDGVATLLRLARDAESGPRAARVRDEVHDAWHAAHERRQSRQRWRLVGLAAAACLTVALGWRLGLFEIGTQPAASDRMAWATSVAGNVRILPTPTTPSVRLLTIEDVVAAGATLDTGAGRAALTLAGGTAIRLDARTRVRIESAEVLHLERGAVYAVAAGTALEVHTPLGVARDIGTRFEVRVEGETLRVRVRDGLVDIEEAGRRRHRAEAGTEVRLAQGRVERSAVPDHGSAWRWTVTIAPPFVLDGASLAAFVSWLETESGWQVRWSDPSLATDANDIALFGPPIEHMGPSQALDAVMAITGLVYQRNGTEIAVARGG